jgi:hypothetical protein
MSKLDGRCGPGEQLYRNHSILAGGEKWNRFTNKYVQFSVGMTISVPTGGGSKAELGLTSQSGLSKNVGMHLQAGKAATQHFFCGDTGGVTNSKRIFSGT